MATIYILHLKTMHARDLLCNIGMKKELNTVASYNAAIYLVMER